MHLKQTFKSTGALQGITSFPLKSSAKKRLIKDYDSPTRDNRSPPALSLIRGKVVAKQGCQGFATTG